MTRLKSRKASTAEPQEALPKDDRPPAQYNPPPPPSSPPVNTHTASNTLVFEILMLDPLSEATRRERRSLLIASVGLISIIATNLLPTRITALGIELGLANRQALLYVFLAVVLYFSVSFLICGVADGGRWLVALHIAADIKPHHRQFAVGEQRIDMSSDDIEESPVTASVPVAIARGFFDFVLPVVIALFAGVAGLIGRIPFSIKIMNGLEETGRGVSEIVRWIGG